MVVTSLFRVNQLPYRRMLSCLLPFFWLTSCLAGEPVTIEVGTLSAEDGDGWILSQIHSFEKAHPEINIRYFAIGKPSRDEVRIEDLPELALNVVGVRSDMGYEVGYLAERGLIVPIDSFLPDPEFHFADFFPNIWDAVTYQGHRWGVPFLASSVVFILDWNLFERAGIPDPPKTWDEVLDQIPKLTRDSDGDGEIDEWGFRLGMRGSYDTHMFFLWMTMVLQQGGTVMSQGRFDLSHPSLHRAYEALRRLQESPGSHTDNRKFKTSAGDLRTRYGMQIAPSYFLNPLMKQHNYRIVHWPTFGKKVVLDERRHYLVIRKSTPEKEKASWEFLKWVTRKNAEHPDGAWTFHLSARKDLLERPEVKQRIKSWARGFEVMHETKGWNVVDGDQIVGRFDAMSHLEEIITQLFQGQWSFEEAMRKAETECNEILAENHENPESYALYSPTRQWPVLQLRTQPTNAHQGSEILEKPQSFIKASSAEIDDASLRNLCKENREVIRCLPWHPGADRVLHAALASLPPGESSLENLFERYPNHPIGLLAFDRFLQSVEPAKRNPLLKSVEHRFSDSALALLAWRHDLRDHLEQGAFPENLEDRAPSLQPGTSLRSKAVRWMTLADASWDHRDFMAASTYYLRFWKSFPDLVKKMKLRRRVIASLGNAGLFLEAQCLSTSSHPQPLAGLLVGDLVSSETRTGESRDDSELAPWIHDLRIACASEYRGEPSLASFEELLDHTLPLSSALTDSASDLLRMAVYMRGVCDLIIRLKSHGDGKRVLLGDYRFDTPAKKEFAIKVVDRSLELACLATSDASRSQPFLFDALDTRIRVGDQVGDMKGNKAAYRKVINGFPNAEETRVYMIRFADSLKARDLEAALDICRQIQTRYPGSPQSRQAMEKQSLWLYESGRLAEARNVLESMKHTLKDPPPSLDALTALCDYALGERETAEERVMEFLKKHPDDDLSSSLRIWLISNRVNEFRFTEANQLIESIMTRDATATHPNRLSTLQGKLLGRRP